MIGDFDGEMGLCSNGDYWENRRKSKSPSPRTERYRDKEIKSILQGCPHLRRMTMPVEKLKIATPGLCDMFFSRDIQLNLCQDMPVQRVHKSELGL